MRKRSLLLSTYGAVFWGHTIAAFAPVQLASFSASPCRRHDTTTCSSIVRAADGNQNAGNNSHGGGDEGAEDTIRVKIWRALASGDELSLSELGNAVGERRHHMLQRRGQPMLLEEAAVLRHGGELHEERRSAVKQRECALALRPREQRWPGSSPRVAIPPWLSQLGEVVGGSVQLHQDVWQEVALRLAVCPHDTQHRWPLGAPAEHGAKAGAAA